MMRRRLKSCNAVVGLASAFTATPVGNSFVSYDFCLSLSDIYGISVIKKTLAWHFHILQLIYITHFYKSPDMLRYT
jgi:hypothetical protein